MTNASQERFREIIQKLKKQVLFLEKNNFFHDELSTYKMADFRGVKIYTRSYPHYPQEKQGNRETFLWKP